MNYQKNAQPQLPRTQGQRRERSRSRMLDAAVLQGDVAKPVDVISNLERTLKPAGRSA